MSHKTLVFIALCLFVSCGSNPTPPRWMDLHDAMEEVKDNMKPIKKSAKANWASYPVKEAQALATIFKDMDQLDEVKKHKDEFKQLLKDSQKLSSDFATAISADKKDKATISNALKAMGRSCKACHDKYKED